jgi:hypothetical protein
LVCLALLHGKPASRRVRKAQRVLAHAQFVAHLHERFPDRVIVLHEGVAHFVWSLVIESRALRGIGLIESLLADYYASVSPALVVLRIVSSLPSSLEHFEVDASAGQEGVALQVHAAIQSVMRSALDD